jgi:hypothetical protein
MIKACENDIQKKAPMIGSKVNVKVDRRDVTGAQGVIRIVFQISRGGGCQVISKHGILSDSNGKPLFIPHDQYIVLDDDTPVDGW